LPSIVMAVGCVKRARLPLLSVVPLAPARPASVVTVPSGAILRIVRLPWSATYTLPFVSTARPRGVLKRAAVPFLSTVPPVVASPARMEMPVLGPPLSPSLPSSVSRFGPPGPHAHSRAATPAHRRRTRRRAGTDSVVMVSISSQQ
jgi:hypothetical protein